jgi:hypothetical protein
METGRAVYIVNGGSAESTPFHLRERLCRNGCGPILTQESPHLGFDGPRHFIADRYTETTRGFSCRLWKTMNDELSIISFTLRESGMQVTEKWIPDNHPIQGSEA